MINREATIRWKGYDPDDLKDKSNKRVWANCDRCGAGRWVIYHQSNRLCYSCSNSGENNAMYDVHLSGKNNGNWKGGKIEIVCDYCGHLIKRFPSESIGYNFCNHECNVRWQEENHIGENNPNWKGGYEQDRSHLLNKKYCIQLNTYFKGSHFHHITRSIGVHIPGELHNHVRHCLKTGNNMGEMNMLSLQYINGYYDEVI